MDDLDGQLVPSGDNEKDAFEVWALLADRSPARTVELCRERLGLELNANTVRSWILRHDWHGRANALLADLAPSYMERTRAALVAAGPPSARYLLDTVEGRIKPDRAAVVAAVAALDRLGFLPFTRREAEQGKSQLGSLSSHSGSLMADLSDTDLAAIVAGRLRAGDVATDT